MSVRVMSWIFQHSDARLGDRLTLLAIADNADDHGTHAWPSIKALAEKARMSPRAIQYSIGRLSEAGSIRVNLHGGPNRANSYEVLMDDANIASRKTQQGSRKIQQGMTQSTSPGTIREPSIEPPIKNSRARASKKFDWVTVEDVPDNVFGSLNDYVAGRFPKIWESGGPMWIRDEIDAALNNVSCKKAIDTARYLKTWLRRGATWEAEHQEVKRNGTSSSHSETRTLEPGSRGPHAFDSYK